MSTDDPESGRTVKWDAEQTAYLSERLAPCLPCEEKAAQDRDSKGDGEASFPQNVTRARIVVVENVSYFPSEGEPELITTRYMRPVTALNSWETPNHTRRILVGDGKPIRISTGNGLPSVVVISNVSETPTTVHVWLDVADVLGYISEIPSGDSLRITRGNGRLSKESEIELACADGPARVKVSVFPL